MLDLQLHKTLKQQSEAYWQQLQVTSTPGKQKISSKTHKTTILICDMIIKPAEVDALWKPILASSQMTEDVRIPSWKEASEQEKEMVRTLTKKSHWNNEPYPWTNNNHTSATFRLCSAFIPAQDQIASSKSPWFKWISQDPRWKMWVVMSTITCKVGRLQQY